MFHRKLSGVSQEVGLTTVLAGKAVDVRPAVCSGPISASAGRWSWMPAAWTLARERGTAEIYLNVLPGRTFEQANTGSSCRRRVRVCGETGVRRA